MLPSHEQPLSLLHRAQLGDAQAREALVLQNTPLVKSIVKRFLGRGSEYEDLFQLGSLGLLKAIEGFDPSFGGRFSTYAVPMITGEIRRFMRDSSPVRVSRSLRDTAYKVISTRQQLEAENGKEASLAEVAAALGIAENDAKDALDAISDPVSLFDPVYHDGNETVLIMEQISDRKNTDEKWVNSVTLSDAIKKLDEREKRILYLRFYQGKTQVEVSDEIGISQAQVSRLEKSAKKSLKKHIE